MDYQKYEFSKMNTQIILPESSVRSSWNQDGKSEWEIAKRLDSAQQTISDHIRKLGFVWEFSRRVPHN